MTGPQRKGPAKRCPIRSNPAHVDPSPPHPLGPCLVRGLRSIVGTAKAWPAQTPSLECVRGNGSASWGTMLPLPNLVPRTSIRGIRCPASRCVDARTEVPGAHRPHCWRSVVVVTGSDGAEGGDTVEDKEKALTTETNCCG